MCYQLFPGERVDVLLSDLDKQFVRYHLINSTFSGQQNVNGVLLADFDGDLNMDVLLVHREAAETVLQIYWGNEDKQSVSK